MLGVVFPSLLLDGCRKRDNKTLRICKVVRLDELWLGRGLCEVAGVIRSALKWSKTSLGMV